MDAAFDYGGGDEEDDLFNDGIDVVYQLDLSQTGVHTDTHLDHPSASSGPKTRGSDRRGVTFASPAAPTPSRPDSTSTHPPYASIPPPVSTSSVVSAVQHDSLLRARDAALAGGSAPVASTWPSNALDSNLAAWPDADPSITALLRELVNVHAAAMPALAQPTHPTPPPPPPPPPVAHEVQGEPEPVGVVARATSTSPQASPVQVRSSVKRPRMSPHVDTTWIAAVEAGHLHVSSTSTVKRLLQPPVSSLSTPTPAAAQVKSTPTGLFQALRVAAASSRPQRELEPQKSTGSGVRPFQAASVPAPAPVQVAPLAVSRPVEVQVAAPRVIAVSRSIQVASGASTDVSLLPSSLAPTSTVPPATDVTPHARASGNLNPALLPTSIARLSRALAATGAPVGETHSPAQKDAATGTGTRSSGVAAAALARLRLEVGHWQSLALHAHAQGVPVAVSTPGRRCAITHAYMRASQTIQALSEASTGVGRALGGGEALLLLRTSTGDELAMARADVVACPLPTLQWVMEVCVRDRGVVHALPAHVEVRILPPTVEVPHPPAHHVFHRHAREDAMLTCVFVMEEVQRAAAEAS